jgi:branched-chain amino acid transport system ATP-binding protein
MLAIRNLSAGYGGRAVIRDISLEVGAGEIVALIGANGAGKSTLAKSISGVLPALAGEIELGGRKVTGLSVAARVRGGLAHVPEGRQVFATLSVEQNLELGAYARPRLSAEEFESGREAVYSRFPVLRQKARDLAGNLSGGQQQMLAIGRGLMAQPKLLILDEPSLGLSPSLVSEVFELIAGLSGQGLAILLAEQNARMSLAIANRGYVIENGRVALSGPAQSLLASEDIAARYLGLGEAGTRGRFDASVHKRLVMAIRQDKTIQQDKAAG